MTYKASIHVHFVDRRDTNLVLFFLTRDAAEECAFSLIRYGLALPEDGRFIPVTRIREVRVFSIGEASQ